MMIFRKSTMHDLDQMAAIAEDGKAFLRSKGVSQWQRGAYPDKAVFEQDVRSGIGYVLAEGDEVLAVCAVTFTDEPSYRNLSSGAWLTGSDAVYATIHRSAVSRAHQGRNLSGVLFSAVETLAAQAHAVSIRVDTHPDNLTMQRALQRAGFQNCGTLVLLEGDEIGDLRFGYEKLVGTGV